MSIDIREYDTEIHYYFVPNPDTRVRVLSSMAKNLGWFDMDVASNMTHAVLTVRSEDGDVAYRMEPNDSESAFGHILLDHPERISATILDNVVSLDTKEQLVWIRCLR